MKEPKEVRTETSYYLVTIFPDPEKTGYCIDTVYKTITGAKKRAKKELLKHPTGKALVRLETVFLRTETAEISTNHAIETITA